MKNSGEMVVIQKPGGGTLAAGGGWSLFENEVAGVDPCGASIAGRRGSLFLGFTVVDRRGSVG